MLSDLTSSVHIYTHQGGLSVAITLSFQLALVPMLFPEKKINVYTNN